MVTKRKPYNCIKESIIKEQADAIAQIQLWLAGNHDPENGMIYKMIDVVNDVKDIKEDIKEIKSTISAAIEGSSKASSALEKYKSETKHFEAGKEAVRVQRNLTLTRIVQIGGLVIAAYMAYLGYKKLEENSLKTDDKIDNLGSPVIVNPRGAFEPLPDGYKIKMWPRDFDSLGADTI